MGVAPPASRVFDTGASALHAGSPAPIQSPIDPIKAKLFTKLRPGTRTGRLSGRLRPPRSVNSAIPVNVPRSTGSFGVGLSHDDFLVRSTAPSGSSAGDPPCSSPTPQETLIDRAWR